MLLIAAMKEAGWPIPRTRSSRPKAIAANGGFGRRSRCIAALPGAPSAKG